MADGGQVGVVNPMFYLGRLADLRLATKPYRISVCSTAHTRTWQTTGVAGIYMSGSMYAQAMLSGPHEQIAAGVLCILGSTCGWLLYGGAVYGVLMLVGHKGQCMHKCSVLNQQNLISSNNHCIPTRWALFNTTLNK